MQFMSKTFLSLQRTHIRTYFILRIRIYCSKFTHKNTTETEYQRQRHETRKTVFNYDGHMEKAGKLAWLHARPSFGVFRSLLASQLQNLPNFPNGKTSGEPEKNVRMKQTMMRKLSAKFSKRFAYESSIIGNI